MRRILNLLFRALSILKRWVKSNPRLASYVADMINVGAFKDKYVHEIMLCDTLRIESYYEAITKIVKEGDIVVDLGTGTGILSFFASSKASKVHAIEHSEIIETAKKVAEYNNITNVEFHHCNSRKFKMDGKADIIIHEQIGNYVFEENMIEALLDLRRRILKKGGRIIPNKFDVFIEPIEMKPEFHRSYMWELDIHDISYRGTKALFNMQPGQGAPFTEYHRVYFEPIQTKHMLCEPKALMTFDLETMNEGDVPESVHYENTAIRDGRIHGLCVGFRAHFDDELSFEAMPIGTQTNWRMTMFRLEECDIRKGQRIIYDLSFGDIRDYETWSLSWHGVEDQAGKAAE